MIFFFHFQVFHGLFRLINATQTFIRKIFESNNSLIFKILYWIIKINEKLWISIIHAVFYISIRVRKVLEIDGKVLYDVVLKENFGYYR